MPTNYLTDLRRRTATVVVLTVSLFAAACGSSASSGEDGAAIETSIESAATSSTEGSSEPADEQQEPEGSDESESDDEAATTRSIETMLGDVEIPIDPEVVVVLDEYAALNLLAVGLTPTVVFEVYQSEVANIILSDLGVELLPASLGVYNYEEIAAFEPDLIVYTATSEVEGTAEPLDAIAPSVVIPYNATWQEILAFVGDLADSTEKAVAISDSLSDSISGFKASWGDETPSLGLLGNTPGFGVFSISEDAPLSVLLSDLGYSRPDAELGPADYNIAVMSSEELLHEHDADLLVVLSGAYYDAESLTSLELFQAVPAVTDGRSVVVDGDIWLGAFPFAVYWALQDLQAVQSGEGQAGVGTVVDTAERWNDFLSTSE